MSAWVKRLALRFLAWLAGDDLKNAEQSRTLAAERDAVIEVPTTVEGTAGRLEEGNF